MLFIYPTLKSPSINTFSFFQECESKNFSNVAMIACHGIPWIIKTIY